MGSRLRSTLEPFYRQGKQPAGVRMREHPQLQEKLKKKKGRVCFFPPFSSPAQKQVGMVEEDELSQERKS